MGVWGTALYANDSACDVKGDYVEKLRRGKSNTEATCELIEDNKDILNNLEEGALFWFALADTQWDYGRLLPEVRNRALYLLDQESELTRWKESSEKNSIAWMKTLEKLKDKLNSPMPQPKKVSQYRLYQCHWKNGDVFAYRFNSDYSKEHGFWGKYILFRKVADTTVWPGHIVPIVQVYKWVGETIPAVQSLDSMELLIQNMTPETLIYKPNYEKEYEITLMSTSKRVIPVKNLSFIGNLPLDNSTDSQKNRLFTNNRYVGWDGTKWNRLFESHVITQYLSWL